MALVWTIGLTSVFAHDGPETDEGLVSVDLAKCESTLKTLNQQTDLDVMNSCIEFYWHNGEYDDPPGSYNKLIRLGKRMVAVDPEQTGIYTMTAWLLWSKYATWRNHPENMPDGATKADEAMELLYQGRRANPEDAAYHNDCGDTITGLAQNYLPNLWAFVEESYRLADRYASESALKVRARLSLGHILRKQKKKSEAIKAYESVLEIDPTNRSALRILEELKAGRDIRIN